MDARPRSAGSLDAGFSASRGPREIEDFVGWDGARPSRAMKLQGTSGAGHYLVGEGDARDEDVDLPHFQAEHPLGRLDDVGLG